MLTLNWIGKSTVVNRHKAVQYRRARGGMALAGGGGNLGMEGEKMELREAPVPFSPGNEGWVDNLFVTCLWASMARKRARRPKIAIHAMDWLRLVFSDENAGAFPRQPRLTLHDD